MVQRFEFIIVIIVLVACGIFLWGTVDASISSLSCNNPADASVYKAPNSAPNDQGAGDKDKDKPKLRCNKTTKLPQINPLIGSTVIPIAATLGTYFGAALGIARKTGGGGGGGGGGEPPRPLLLRWGAVVGENDKKLSYLQTAAAYIYLLGLIISFVALAWDSGIEGSIDSPYTHLIVRTQGAAFIGVVVGILALVLGVEPAKTVPPNPVPNVRRGD